MAITPKSKDKYVEKCSTAQSFIFPKWHSFKIGTLIIYLVFRSEKNIKLLQLLESTIHSQCKYPLS